MWGATAIVDLAKLLAEQFQSTRPVWGATTHHRLVVLLSVISIHAPRVGRDSKSHSPFLRVGLFQSTRPVWGATTFEQAFGEVEVNFNPRAPCGARHTLPRMIGNALVISIHAPRVGRDLIDNYTFLAASQFQSTRPVWGATSGGAKVEAHTVISIHAPRVGRDADQLLCRGQVSIFQSTRPVWGATMHHRRNVGGRNYFNPRAPCGARHLMRGDSRP